MLPYASYDFIINESDSIRKERLLCLTMGALPAVTATRLI